MNLDQSKSELYQQVILEHNKRPKNFREMSNPTHHAEGYNPLCGDHLKIFLRVDNQKIIEEVSFVGEGCAISKASASMMTAALKGKKLDEAKTLFTQFNNLVKGQLDPEKDNNILGKLKVFCGIWHYPSRVKCASLCWHAMKGAVENVDSITTE